MAEIGRFNYVEVLRELDFGVYLDGGELGEILLPRRYVPSQCKPGDYIEVFIYIDSEDRIIATTERPYAAVGDFALLRVVSVSEFGAFLDWGLSKDLLVPFREQQQKMEEDRWYVVRVYLDRKSNRIAASSKLDKFLDKTPGSFREGQGVDLVVCDRTDVGYKAIINGTHWGVLYHNEVFQQLQPGEQVPGFIKKVREDGKIDLCLQKPGYGKIDDIVEQVLNTLKDRGGFIPVTDKSSPDTIAGLFGISKKTYKKAIGALYKKRLITIEDDGIQIIGTGEKK